MNRKHIGFELAKGERSTLITVDSELRDYFKSLFSKKNHTDYLKEFLIHYVN